jgi:membrane protease YdiL (CAAX protease family)
MTPVWFDHVLVLCFAVLLPLRSATGGYRRLAKVPAHATALRMRFYRLSLLLHFAMLVLVLVAWSAGGRDWMRLGIRFPDPWPVVLATGLVVGLLCGFYRLILEEQRRRESPAVQVERLGRLVPLMPRTRDELDLFIVLLLLAAASEELLFRAYLTAYLNSYMPLSAAAALSVIAFAVGHVYQGAKGVAQTGIIGAMCMILYLATGSLLPGVVLHAGLNYISAHAGYAIVRAMPRA